MTRPRWLSPALTAFALIAGCAGGGGSDVAPATTRGPQPTTTLPTDPCDAVELEATDVGITEDKIVVEVVADLSGDGVAERSSAAVAAVEAWADDVNERGGLACRSVEVRDWDSELSPQATTEGTADACEKAAAMVGTTALLLLDATNLNACRDEVRGIVDLPDVAATAVEVPHQCNPTTFPVVATPGSCPYTGGPREFAELVGPFRYFASLAPSANAVMLTAGETPTTAEASLNQARAAQAAGLVTIDADIPATEHDRSDAATRAFGFATANRSTIVHNDAHYSVLTEMRRIAADADAGPDSVRVWACSSACYSRSFLASDEAEGTYVWLPHLPLEEASDDPTIDAYLEALDDRGTVSSAGFAAWTAATTFELVVARIVQRQGDNGVTRARILDELAALRQGTATAAGLDAYGADHVLGSTPRCFVVLRVRRGEFRRVHPAQPGTLDCADENVSVLTVDPEAPQTL